MIVCICGPDRFPALWEKAAILETAAGNIVLTAPIRFGDYNHESVLRDYGYSPEEVRRQAGELHLRKIDMADEVLILNMGGYLDQSIEREAAYAYSRGKRVRWWECPEDWIFHPDAAVRDVRGTAPIAEVHLPGDAPPGKLAAPATTRRKNAQVSSSSSSRHGSPRNRDSGTRQHRLHRLRDIPGQPERVAHYVDRPGCQQDLHVPGL